MGLTMRGAVRYREGNEIDAPNRERRRSFLSFFLGKEKYFSLGIVYIIQIVIHRSIRPSIVPKVLYRFLDRACYATDLSTPGNQPPTSFQRSKTLLSPLLYRTLDDRMITF